MFLKINQIKEINEQPKFSIFGKLGLNMIQNYNLITSVYIIKDHLLRKLKRRLKRGFNKVGVQSQWNTPFDLKSISSWVLEINSTLSIQIGTWFISKR